MHGSINNLYIHSITLHIACILSKKKNNKEKCTFRIKCLHIYTNFIIQVDVLFINTLLLFIYLPNLSLNLSSSCEYACVHKSDDYDI